MRAAGRSTARLSHAVLVKARGGALIRRALCPRKLQCSPVERIDRTSGRRCISRLAHASKGVHSQLATDPENDLFARRSSENFVKARLQTALNPPSSSTTPTPPPNALDLLEIVTPLIGTPYEDLLIPHLRPIATSISAHFIAQPPNDSAQLEAVLKILGLCWIKSIHLVPPPGTPSPPRPKITPVANQYISFVLSIARADSTPQDSTIAFESVNNTIRKASKESSYRLPLESLVAWLILRIRVKSTAPAGFRVQLPPLNHILEQLQDSPVPGIDSSTLIAKASDLYKALSKNNIPDTPEALERRLESFKIKGNVDGMIDLWAGFCDARNCQEMAGPWAPLLEPMHVDEALGVFLYAFKSNKPTISQPGLKEQLDNTATEIMSQLPRPVPLAVHQKLMYLRARVDDMPLAIGTDIRALDDDSERLPSSARESALTNLEAAWQAANSEGVAKDVKLYLTYIEGLGRLGDLDGVQKAWNQLVTDQAARELYHKTEDDPKAPFPPTRALNHMLASCFLVSGSGPEVALELFRQASLPTSTIPINLVTINTVLRHFAVKGDIAGMSVLFNLAEGHNLKPDVITYTTLIQGLLRADQLEMAKRALIAMQNANVSPNERMYSLLIADLAKSGSREGLLHAEIMMKEMRKRGLSVGSITWTGLISGYFRGGWEEDGWAAVKRMTDSGKHLTKVGYNMVLRQALLSETGASPHLNRDGSTLAMRLLHRMIKEGHDPSSDTFAIVLGPLVKRKKWQEAAEVLSLMERLRFRPEKGSLRMLVSTCLSNMPQSLASNIKI